MKYSKYNLMVTKNSEQYLFSNLLTKIHIVVYLKDIIQGEARYEKEKSCMYVVDDRCISFLY